MSRKEVVSTGKPFSAVGPYSQAVKAGPFLFVSGQIPVDPQTGQLVEGTIEEKIGRVLDNVDEILKAAGCSFDDLVKVTVFARDMSIFSDFNKIYAARFRESFPARSFVEVSNLPRGVDLEVEAIALLPSADEA